mmetsp:Transcript_67900/g.159838  ORF Transcript_67900/g.159838 Transcript_67900/m.159838 type:complete len:91 (-) Transcript_67900:96-368(-)
MALRSILRTGFGSSMMERCPSIASGSSGSEKTVAFDVACDSSHHDGDNTRKVLDKYMAGPVVGCSRNTDPLDRPLKLQQSSLWRKRKDST